MELIGTLQQQVFEGLILPLMLALGLDAQIEDGYVGALWLIAGVAQLLVLVLVLVPLQLSNQSSQLCWLKLAQTK